MFTKDMLQQSHGLMLWGATVHGWDVLPRVVKMVDYGSGTLVRMTILPRWLCMGIKVAEGLSQESLSVRLFAPWVCGLCEAHTRSEHKSSSLCMQAGHLQGTWLQHVVLTTHCAYWILVVAWGNLLVYQFLITRTASQLQEAFLWSDVAMALSRLLTRISCRLSTASMSVTAP